MIKIQTPGIDAIVDARSRLIDKRIYILGGNPAQFDTQRMAYDHLAMRNRRWVYADSRLLDDQTFIERVKNYIK